MSDTNRPDIPPEDYDKPVGGGDLPPLELLPEREWLGARISDVEYRVVVFNNQIQYLTKKEWDEAEQKEVDVQILDDNQQPIPRREFFVTFEFHNYELPNGKGPRRAWLQMGASLGDGAHLPTFLGNVVGFDKELKTPSEIIGALKGKEVKLQLGNKPRKDKTKPPYQKVIYDAVKALDGAPTPEPVTPMTGQDVGQEVNAPVEGGDNPEVAWDE